MKLNRNTAALLLAASVAASGSPILANDDTPAAGVPAVTQSDATEPSAPVITQPADGTTETQPPVSGQPQDPIPAQPEPEPGDDQADGFIPEADSSDKPEETAVQSQTDTTLQQRINQAAQDEQIVLQNDCSEHLVIPAGKKITLNLNGHSIRAEGNDQAAVTVEQDADLILTGSGVISTNNTGMGIDVTGGSLTLDGPAVRDNTVSGSERAFSGAGITVTNGSFHFISGSITANLATADGAGGLMLSNSVFVMEPAASITGNRAWTTRGGTGPRPTGGIRIHGCQNALINGGTVSGNTGFYTGALFMDNSNSSLTITGGSFTDNEGGLSGGIITENDVLTIQGGQFTGNKLVSGPFWNKYADAGAIGCCDGTLDLNGSANGGILIADNQTSGTGGGIFVEGRCRTTISGAVTIEHNSAGTCGGGLMASHHTDTAPNVTIGEGVTIDNNTAGKAGNDIYASSQDSSGPASRLILSAHSPDRILDQDQTAITGWFADPEDQRWTRDFTSSYWDHKDQRKDPQEFTGAALIAAHEVQGSLIVVLKDESGNILKQTDPEFFDKGAAYDVKSQIPETVTQNGQTWKRMTMPENAAGTISKEATEVTAVYGLLKMNVSLQPVDQEGNPLLPARILLENEPSGTSYDIRPDIEKTIQVQGKTWELVSLPENAAGTLADEDVTVNPVYKRLSVKVTIQPVDKEGNPIGDSIAGLTDGDPGGDYDVRKLIPDSFKDDNGISWKLVTMPAESQGTLGNSDILVKAVYQKVVPTKTVEKKPTAQAGKFNASKSVPLNTSRKTVTTSVSMQASGLLLTAAVSLAAMFWLNRKRKQ